MDDPGWKPALGGLWKGLVPNLAMRIGRHTKPALIFLRSVWLSMLVTWILFGSLLRIIEMDSTGRSTAVLAWVAGVGVLDLGLLLVVRSLRLKGEDGPAIAASFAQVSLGGWAVTNASVLWGFVGFFLNGGMSAFLVGTAFGLAGFVLMAPTRSNLDHFQQRIRDSGVTLSLMQALAAPIPRKPSAGK